MAEIGGIGQLRRAELFLRGTDPVPERALLDALLAIRVALAHADGWPKHAGTAARALSHTAYLTSDAAAAAANADAAYVARLRSGLAALAAAAGEP